MTIRPDLKDWKFWFAIIGAICSFFMGVTQLNSRISVLETKVDLLLAVEGVKPNKTAKESDEVLWPWEEWEDVQTAEIK